MPTRPPVANPDAPALNMTNSTGGLGAEPGYNYFFPAVHTKLHVIKSRVPPCQIDRRKENPVRVPAESYTTHALHVAVRRAAAKAGVPHWHPNRLRHLYATEVRRGFGLEAAGASLGHSKMSATEVYAERDLGTAVRIAIAIG